MSYARTGMPGRGPQATQTRRRAVNQEEIAGWREQVPHQPLTIAPEPIDLAPRPAPSVMLPALQPDAGHPTAALAHRRPESSGKIFAGGHWNAPRKAHRHEDLTAAQSVETEPGFVVLGEAFGVENPS